MDEVTVLQLQDGGRRPYSSLLEKSGRLSKYSSTAQVLSVLQVLWMHLNHNMNLLRKISAIQPLRFLLLGEFKGISISSGDD